MCRYCGVDADYKRRYAVPFEVLECRNCGAEFKSEIEGMRVGQAVIPAGAHWGDPCRYCGQPHDSVAVGDCPGARDCFSVGDVCTPLPEDLRYTDRAVAEVVATQASERDTSQVWAIWAEESGEVLALAFAGVIFHP